MIYFWGAKMIHRLSVWIGNLFCALNRRWYATFAHVECTSKPFYQGCPPRRCIANVRIQIQRQFCICYDGGQVPSSPKCIANIQIQRQPCICFDTEARRWTWFISPLQQHDVYYGDPLEWKQVIHCSLTAINTDSHTWCLSIEVHRHIIKACKKYTKKRVSSRPNSPNWAKILRFLIYAKMDTSSKKYTTAG